VALAMVGWTEARATEDTLLHAIESLEVFASIQKPKMELRFFTILCYDLNAKSFTGFFMENDHPKV